MFLNYEGFSEALIVIILFIVMKFDKTLSKKLSGSWKLPYLYNFQSFLQFKQISIESFENF